MELEWNMVFDFNETLLGFSSVISLFLIGLHFSTRQDTGTSYELFSVMLKTILVNVYSFFFQYYRVPEKGEDQISVLFSGS